MKRILFAALALIVGHLAFAQTSPSAGALTTPAPSTTPTPSFHRFVFSANAGAGIPTGSFGKGDYADERSGFASTGGHFNLTGTYYISKRFGIGVLLGYSQFGFKGSQSLSDGYKEDSGTDSTTLFTKGQNHSLSMLAGPSFNIPLGKKLKVGLRAMGGYVSTHLAGFQIFYEDYTDNSMTQRGASGGGFGFQLGAGLSYPITSCIAVQANADYFSSRPRIDMEYDDFVVNSGRRLNAYDQSISGLNVTLGLAFSL
ncbi:MAG TPA: outer membrane beta-barrel protein [Puia sp.]|nr:outer membrane beta-barrel protein [Puia sp.]